MPTLVYLMYAYTENVDHFHRFSAADFVWRSTMTATNHDQQLGEIYPTM